MRRGIPQRRIERRFWVREGAFAGCFEAIKRSHIAPKVIDNVVFGNVIHDNSGSAYIARHIGLEAGVSIETRLLQ